jgi:hypothetical protein
VNSIISVLVAYNQFLLAQIHHLLVFIAKNIPLKSPKYDITSPKYNKLTVDKLPVIKKIEPMNYILLLRNTSPSMARVSSPSNPAAKNPVPPDCVCLYCGAPHTYLYDNTGAVASCCVKFVRPGSPKPLLRLILSLGYPSYALTAVTLWPKRRIASISTFTSASTRTVPSTLMQPQ